MASREDLIKHSLTYSFAIADSMIALFPIFFNHPILYMSNLEVSILTFISAILFDMDWNLPIGLPNWCRSIAYLIHVSNCLSMVPTQLASMQLLSHSIEELNIKPPAPSLPNKFSSGTLQLSKITSPIGDVLKPILSNSLLIENPGVPFSTRNAEIPLPPLDLSIVANTNTKSAMGAFVINIFVPFNMYLSPTFWAVV